jgi:hypothetical protein
VRHKFYQHFGTEEELNRERQFAETWKPEKTMYSFRGKSSKPIAKSIAKKDEDVL